MPAVQFERLTVQRGGRVVLHDLQGSSAAGRVTGLFAPNGTGTSTLVRFAGALIVRGRDVEAGGPTEPRRVRTTTSVLGP